MSMLRAILEPRASQTMSQQIDTYLSRMRFMHRLPVDIEHVYYGCMPPAIKQWFESGPRPNQPGRSGNVLLTMNQTSNPNLRAYQLHISVESTKEYCDAMDGQRGHEKLFWIDIDPTLPVPRNSLQTPFFLPLDHPHREEIVAWVDTAYTIDNEIESTVRQFKMLENSIGAANRAVAAKVWPELANFLVFVKGAPNNISQKVMREVNLLLTEEFKQTTNFLLARAAMLDSKHMPLRSWVKFYSKEIAR